MRPSEIVERERPRMRDIVARYPVANPRLFGSVATGQDHEGSDVDLLVQATEGTTLFDLAGLSIDLSHLLGLRVDIVTDGSLTGARRASALSEARPL